MLICVNEQAALKSPPCWLPAARLRGAWRNREALREGREFALLTLHLKQTGTGAL